MTPHPDETQDRPVFGCSLEGHLRVYKREIAVVIEECITALRENWMDTEGLFRIAASSAKTKFLKVGSVGHDTVGQNLRYPSN